MISVTNHPPRPPISEGLSITHFPLDGQAQNAAKPLQAFDLVRFAKENRHMSQFIQRTTKDMLSRLRPKRLLSRVVRPAFAGLFLVGAVAGTATAAGPTVKQAATPQSHWYQIGKASWYGGQFQGRKTATGEIYDMNQLTCAHRSLPLGTWLRVTNLHLSLN